MVLPEPGDTCPTFPCIRPTVEVTETLEVREPRAETSRRWAERTQAKAPLCACGCGTQVEVKPKHRARTKGLPRYVQGHHPNPLRRLYLYIEEEGLFTTGEVCAHLCISQSSYHRLETAGVFPPPRRWGKWPRSKMRVFTRAEVRSLERLLKRSRNDRRL
jgi:predicted DNA-binding transcriptional regulator AlpA